MLGGCWSVGRVEFWEIVFCSCSGAAKKFWLREFSVHRYEECVIWLWYKGQRFGRDDFDVGHSDIPKSEAMRMILKLSAR